MPLFITEYSALSQIPGAQMSQESAIIAAYSVPIGGASGQSQTFNPKTRVIEIHCDAPCSIDIGLNPTAVTTARRMAANQSTYRNVPEGGNYKIAVISNS